MRNGIRIRGTAPAGSGAHRCMHVDRVSRSHAAAGRVVAAVNTSGHRDECQARVIRRIRAYPSMTPLSEHEGDLHPRWAAADNPGAHVSPRRRPAIRAACSVDLADRRGPTGRDPACTGKLAHSVRTGPKHARRRKARGPCARLPAALPRDNERGTVIARTTTRAQSPGRPSAPRPGTGGRCRGAP